MLDKIREFKEEVETDWLENIAPFWLTRAPDKKHGGFFGMVAADLKPDESAGKGIILNSRILWTFSKAYSIYKKEEYLEIADRAFNYLNEHFFDPRHGGVFWTVDYRGKPFDTKKRPYAQAFTIYAYSEFYAAAKNESALNKAFELFEILETRCRDRKDDGYFETFERDWQLSEDMRLSETDQNAAKSMNNHLHVLEAYTNLYRVSKNDSVRERLGILIGLFENKIYDAGKKSLKMFFRADWQAASQVSSFGHDIETSWLLSEAAGVLGDESRLGQIRKICLELAATVFDKGLAEDGSLLYESEKGEIINADREWWVQAECIIGFLNASALSDNDEYLNAALAVWKYTGEKIIDRKNGGWHWRIKAENGLPDPARAKISQWKCPYHNGRMSFEVRNRLGIEENQREYG
jgi:mannobiose 2-epimerase